MRPHPHRGYVVTLPLANGPCGRAKTCGWALNVGTTRRVRHVNPLVVPEHAPMRSWFAPQTMLLQGLQLLMLTRYLGAPFNKGLMAVKSTFFHPPRVRPNGGCIARVVSKNEIKNNPHPEHITARLPRLQV